MVDWLCSGEDEEGERRSNGEAKKIERKMK